MTPADVYYGRREEILRLQCTGIGFYWSFNAGAGFLLWNLLTYASACLDL